MADYATLACCNEINAITAVIAGLVPAIPDQVP
jgi:hypothetical protein